MITNLKCKECGNLLRLTQGANSFIHPDYLICSICRSLVNHYDYLELKDKIKINDKQRLPLDYGNV
jgi:uncharacterized UBP type Zn finger protein